ncbi:PepSY domain-containing protein [uncultured Roseibium sp.]|uniref:PepSY domain-containing protein n=1 Tax=uncultured Roseibium sp. TaxID=1936171 RepID=UPI002611253E|nr:PepSY domain-containing protein [uncultured Roseibium sp.]
MNLTLHTAISLLMCVFTFPACATGLYECAPTERSSWLTQDEVTEKLIGEGWQVRRMKEDGGCWEVYGTTPQGQRVEVYLDPVSGEVLLINQRGTILFRKDS